MCTTASDLTSLRSRYMRYQGDYSVQPKLPCRQEYVGQFLQYSGRVKNISNYMHTTCLLLRWSCVHWSCLQMLTQLLVRQSHCFICHLMLPLLCSCQGYLGRYSLCSGEAASTQNYWGTYATVLQLMHLVLDLWWWIVKSGILWLYYTVQVASYQCNVM